MGAGQNSLAKLKRGEKTLRLFVTRRLCPGGGQPAELRPELRAQAVPGFPAQSRRWVSGLRQESWAGGVAPPPPKGRSLLGRLSENPNNDFVNGIPSPNLNFKTSK